jgi:hypothetical protein
MKRRTLLGRAAAVTGGGLALAGCLRDGREDEVLTQSGTEFGEDEEGRLTYTVTVSNPSDREATGTLYVNSELDGEATTKVRQVSLPPHTTESFTFTYDVPYDDLPGSFSPEVDLQEN